MQLITIPIVKTPHPVFAAGSAVLDQLRAEATLSRLAVDDDTTKATTDGSSPDLGLKTW